MGARESHTGAATNGCGTKSRNCAETFHSPHSLQFSPSKMHLNRLQNMYNGSEFVLSPNTSKKLAGDMASMVSYTSEKLKLKKCCGDDNIDVSHVESELESSVGTGTFSKYNQNSKLSFLKSFRSFVEDDENSILSDEYSSSSESESLISPQLFLAKIRENLGNSLRNYKTVRQQEHRFYLSPSPSTSTMSSGIDIPEEFLKHTLPEIKKNAKVMTNPAQSIDKISEQLSKRNETLIKTMPSYNSLCTEKRLSDWDPGTLNSTLESDGKLAWISPCPSPSMGFQTLQDGEAIFTAFLRMHGDQVTGWKKLMKRSERVLKGLQRQHSCQIKLYDTPTNINSMTVHKLCIRGSSKRAVLRCKNAMPLYITEFLITSHDSNQDFARCVAPRR